jgi:Tol biopolymer transport system component/tetratricopeptide (TPR) repeat protein
MKYKIFFVIALILLLFFACNDRKPVGNMFAWSPDGKLLAMVQFNSDELLLIETGENEIKQITIVDTQAVMPQWSFDGRYLLYYKKIKKSERVGIFVYTLANKKSEQVADIPKKLWESDTFWENGYCATWSPVEDTFCYVSQQNEETWLLNSLSVMDNRHRTLLLSRIKPLLPQWSRDGKWIYYVLDNSNKKENRGLWAISHDGSGSRHMIKREEITDFKQSPDGNHWAYTRKIIEKDKEYYQLMITDAEFKTRLSYDRTPQIISNFDWSPDASQIICLMSEDDTVNLWLAGLKSRRLVKITFDNLVGYDGWHGIDTFSYTVQYPQNVIALSKEEQDSKELMETMSGLLFENIHMQFSGNQFKKIGLNRFFYTLKQETGHSAFYIDRRKPFNFYGNTIYLPVLMFANGTVKYLGRTASEHVEIAQIYYNQGKFQDAKENLDHYWQQEYQTNDVMDFFAAQSALELMQSGKDSTKLSNIVEEVKNGMLFRTVLIFRRTGNLKKAEKLLEQLRIVISDDSSYAQIFDLFSIVLVNAYIEYKQVDEGLRDLEMMLSWRQADSAYIAHTYFSQAFLFEFIDNLQAMKEKIVLGMRFLPHDGTDEILIWFIEKYKNNKEISNLLIPTVQRVLVNNNEEKERAQLLAEMYLTHGDREKAYLAYQKAVTAGFDQYKLWQALFALRLELRR